MGSFPGSPFGSLPFELREEIWTFALLPSPGVYHLDPQSFTLTEDGCALEDARWFLPKRKFPTAMHLCRESRHLALTIKERERGLDAQKLFCLGDAVRLFDPDMDTLWLDNYDAYHALMLHPRGVFGRRIHFVQNLALSSDFIWSVPLEPERYDLSNWDAFRWRRLPRFVSLRHVDVVFGTEDYKPLFKLGLGGDVAGFSSVPEISLEAWVQGSSNDTEDYVFAQMAKTERDTSQVFRQVFETPEQEEKWEPQLDDAPGWQDGSGITFRAARMVRVVTYNQ